MKLFSNGFFQLDYSAATDILSMKLPDMQTAGLSEAEHCFDTMLEHVKNYHVKNLMLDSTNANVNVGDEEYHDLIFRVSMKLKETRLQKVARLNSAKEDLEKNAVKVQQQVLSTMPDTYKIRNFNNPEDAVNWLTDKG